MDKRRRNRCQFCRFQKCLAVGMVKEGGRPGWAGGTEVGLSWVGQTEAPQTSVLVGRSGWHKQALRALPLWSTCLARGPGAGGRGVLSVGSLALGP